MTGGGRLRFPRLPLPGRRGSGIVPGLPLRVPPAFTLEITAQCNFDCPYCYCLWHEFPELARKSLSPEEWRKIISLLIRRGVTDLTFSGGEALLYPHCPELLAFARRALPAGRITLFTNGSLLTGELLRKLHDTKFGLAVSWQGIRSYAGMTGSSLSCRHVRDLLEQCREIGLDVSVSTVVTQLNRQEICDVFAAAAEAGAKFIQLGPMMVQGRGRHRPDLALSRSEWEETKERIRHMKNCHTKYAFCEEMICRCRKHPRELLERFALPGKPEPCPAGKTMGVISPDGSFRKCLHHIESR